MDNQQAEFFRARILPIIREEAEDGEERNPLRPMLRDVIGYAEYLEGQLAKTQKLDGPKREEEGSGKTPQVSPLKGNRA